MTTGPEFDCTLHSAVRSNRNPLRVFQALPLESVMVLPAHNKPDKPGIWMNFDNTVSIYQVVGTDTGFMEAAQDSFRLLKDAQDQFPDWPRIFYLEVSGHRSPTRQFDEDFVEFQQEFWFSTIAPFLTCFDLPLTGPLANPDEQRNDLPDSLVVR